MTYGIVSRPLNDKDGLLLTPSQSVQQAENLIESSRIKSTQGCRQLRLSRARHLKN